jgi:hypothetical protein
MAADDPVQTGGILMEKKRAEVHQLDNVLVESIEETLTGLLGIKAREAIYDHLERNHLIARSEIPSHLDDFFRLLEETFGRGSRTIGRAIVRHLFAKFGWEFVEMPSYELSDYLKAVKERLEREPLPSTDHV